MVGRFFPIVKRFNHLSWRELRGRDDTALVGNNNYPAKVGPVKTVARDMTAKAAR